MLFRSYSGMAFGPQMSLDSADVVPAQPAQPAQPAPAKQGIAGLNPQSQSSFNQLLQQEQNRINSWVPRDYTQLMTEMQNAQGFPELRQHVVDQLGNAHDVAQRQFDLANGKGAAAAGMEAGELTAGASGMDPHYAGQGLASILTTMNRNIAGHAAAQTQAGKDFAASQLALTKMDMDSTLADEANRRNDIRYAMGLTKEDMRDHANEINSYIGHRIALEGVQETAAGRLEAARGRTESNELTKALYADPLKEQQRLVLEGLRKKYPGQEDKVLQEYNKMTIPGQKLNLEAKKTLENNADYMKQYNIYTNANSTNAQKDTARRLMIAKARELEVDENLAVPGEALAFPSTLQTYGK